MILLLITFLAGVLTILSPCILPVLPFVFARTERSFARSGLPLLAGMSFTFSVFSALAIAGGKWVGQANEVGRVLAMILLTLFGLSLLFPSVADKWLAPFTRMGSKLGSGVRDESMFGSFIIGISTGLLWAPCAGPILGLVLTGAATQGEIGTSIGLLAAYSLGAATSLGLAMVAGSRLLVHLKKFLGVDRTVKKVLGVAVLAGVAAIALNLDRTLLVKLSKVETASLESKLLSLAQKEPAPHETQPGVATGDTTVGEGPMPELSGAESWLNSKALTREELRGKVVLIDFWTYSCINCLRTLPYVKAWAEKYKNDGLVVIGVHTPEFAFERSPSNVEQAMKDLGVTYPVALDNERVIWRAFENHYWPAHYFIDRQGRIRHHHFGEGGYAESEKWIRDLISEEGGRVLVQAPDGAALAELQAHGAEAPADQTQVKSPETYIGYERAENYAGKPSLEYDVETQYRPAKSFKLNQWALAGRWLVAKEEAQATQAGGKVLFQFHARDLHLVLGAKSPVPFVVRIDGKPPGDSHGMDIDADGKGQVKGHRLYQLIRQKAGAPVTDHLFEIEFAAPGVSVYAFTFG